ncbi:MAG TPA: alpha/beta hydrolase family protein [Solirubrobacteraceae bacterium]|nr:alpha/beta hydrolase family protein [Solirubrobacteraceae bacterium]
MRARLVLCTAVLALALAPAATQAARLQTWTTPSRFVDLTKVKFNSLPAGSPLKLNVLLPDGYDGRRRFPVLYLLHGHGDNYASWARSDRGDVLDIAKGMPAIIVMPEGATGWYTNWWDAGARGADGRAWENYYLDELIPFVENHLRIVAGRSNHAIAGLSMGGEGATYLAEQLPGYFGSVATFSGAISIQRAEWPQGFDTQGESHADVYGDPSAQQFYWRGHNPTALTENLAHSRVFVAVGDGTPDPTSPSQVSNYFGAVAETELHQHANDFVASAQAAGADVTYRPQQGIHDWPYWRQHLQQALAWGLFKPVSPAPASWRYETVARSGRAWDLRFTFSAPPETTIVLQRDGQTLRATGSGRVTIVPDGAAAFTATLPFTRAIAAARSPRTPPRRRPAAACPRGRGHRGAPARSRRTRVSKRHCRRRPAQTRRHKR